MKGKKRIRNAILFMACMTGIAMLSGVVMAGTAPAEEWNKTYGINGEQANDVQQTSDGGYIFAGNTYSYGTINKYGTGSGDIWLVKTDPNGNESWNKTFGGIDIDRAYSVQQTSDGGYIIAGDTKNSTTLYFDAWLVKTDSNGNEIWNKKFGGSDDDSFYSVQQTSDGGYILAGVTRSYDILISDAWLVKTDPNGNESWNKTFSGAIYSVNPIYSVQQTSDGGYILAGEKAAGAWLIKTNTNGNESWNKTFGGKSVASFYSVRQTSDGGNILAGVTGADAWLVKTDTDGNQLWSKTFGGILSTLAYSVRQTSDGGYILAGYSYTGEFAALLIKTDLNGNQSWNKTFGGKTSDVVYSVRQTSDGGYILAGSRALKGLAWLIKVSNETADDIPPNTTIVLSGTLKNSTWYASDVEVNFTAKDNVGGSGINLTEYSFDDIAWTTYISNFTVSAEGMTIVYYRSKDNAGNIEETKNVSINIDKTKPKNPIGYQFPNFGLAPLPLTWGLFRNTYGADKVEYPDGTDRLGADIFYLKAYSNSAGSGSCFGMAASGLVLYNDNLDPWNMAGYSATDLANGRNRSLDLEDVYIDTNGNGIYDQGEPLTRDWNYNGTWDYAPRTWRVFPLFTRTSEDWVEYYHGRQFDSAVQGDRKKYADPNKIYAELKQRMDSGNYWMNDPMVLGMLFPPGQGGHAVLPYKIVESLDHKFGNVSVWDSNDPGKEHIFTFDLEQGNATYDASGLSIMNVTAGINVTAISLTAIQSPPQLPTFYDLADRLVDLFYTNDAGNHLGYQNGVFLDEIPGAYKIEPLNGIGNFPEMYNTSGIQLKRQLWGRDDGISTAYFMRPNSLAVVDAQVRSGSIDEVNVSSDGSSIKFISGNGTGILNLSLDTETPDFGRNMQINTTGLEPGNSVQLMHSGDKVGVANKGKEKTYTMSLEQIGSNQGSLSGQIVIEENSTQWLTPENWSNLNSTSVVLEHDIGSDGSIDRTEILGSTPPTIIIGTPTNGSIYILNQTVIANWSAAGESGSNTVTATVANGTPIDTATVGTKTFSVNATDIAGSQANKTVTYIVVYNYSGILPPINASGNSTFKLGSTVPVKFQLWDANGNNVSTAIARMYLTNITKGAAGKEINGTSTSNATTGNLFRYDNISNQYIFNLATKPLSFGTWQIRIYLDDGTSKYAKIGLK